MNTGKVLLIGGGIAAFLLRDHIAALINPAPAAAPHPPAGSSTGSGTSTGTSTPPPPPPAPGIWDRLKTWAQTQPDFIATGTMNTHQWNWGYQQFRGKPGPSPDQIGQGDGNTKITYDEYKTAMTAAGLNGLGKTQPRRAVRLTAGGFARSAWGY
jgi:hypothetical protein